MNDERRKCRRIKTLEIADLYFDNRFVKHCEVSCISPNGVFVQDRFAARLKRGALIDLYFSIDLQATPDSRLLCLRGIVARTAADGAGVRVYSKRLPFVPAAGAQVGAAPGDAKTGRK